MTRKRVWRTHTGSNPACQDSPRAQIQAWFDGAPIRISDAPAVFANMLELQQYQEEGDNNPEDHRCYNRREYELTLRDVRNIIRDLKEEGS